MTGQSDPFAVAGLEAQANGAEQVLRRAEIRTRNPPGENLRGLTGSGNPEISAAWACGPRGP